MKKSKQLRNQIKAARADIPARYQQLVSLKIAEQIAALKEYQSAKHIAGYVAINGECDPKPLLDRARQAGKTTYLATIVERKQPLMFGRFDGDTALVRSGFGLFEPKVTSDERVAGSGVDLVVVPMVGFDEECNRLGMGGGYYDRTFEFLKTDRSKGPVLIGIAYEQQKLDSIEINDWDVPLDMVVTESTIYRS